MTLLSGSRQGREDDRVTETRRAIAAVACVIAAVAVVGLIKRPDLTPLRIFMLAFAVATVPRWLLARVRRVRSYLRSR